MGFTRPEALAGVRLATAADAGGIANTLALAFQNDPLWGWGFPDPEQRYRQFRALWGFYVDSALRYPWTWTTANYEAVSVWIPPGGTELSAQAEIEVESLVARLLPGDAQRVLGTMEVLEHAHPTQPAHYYLSLVGTHPDHRGRGIGIALLADNLVRIDAEHAPAYLESSNPANHARYESIGFQRTGEVAAPGGPPVATMWREPR